MRLWTPSRDEPELLVWWSALLMFARIVREDDVPWQIHIDEFDLLGRVDRDAKRQPIWVYRHRGSGRDIYVDPTGQTYRFRPTPNAAGAGRFNRCAVRAAVHLAGLPEVVRPVFFEPPTNSPWPMDSEGPELEPAHPAERGRATRRPTRPRVSRGKRWLHLVPTVPA